MAGKDGSYRIDPAAVDATLRATSREIGEYEHVVAPLADAVHGALTSMGDSAVVMSAFAAFVQAQDERVRRVAGRMTSCVVGAREGAAAYETGDAEMAATHDRAHGETTFPARRPNARPPISPERGLVR